MYIFARTVSQLSVTSTGQEEKATEILLEIAKQNGTLLNETKIKVQEMVKELGKSLRNNEANNCENQKEKVGVWDLLSNARLAFHFWMLAIALSMSYLSYDVLTLNSTKMAGNRFLNYFYLSLVELPAGWVGGKLVEVTGRRWTQVGFFLVCISSCLLCAVAVAYPGSTVIVIIGALGVKFAVTVTSLVATIQATEIFPTPLRSTGNGLATTVSSVLGLFGPYMVYIGTIHPSLPYGILLICSAVGLASASLLPETLQQPLPETVTEANEFGKGQRFWSYLPTQKAKNSTSC